VTTGEADLAAATLEAVPARQGPRGGRSTRARSSGSAARACCATSTTRPKRVSQKVTELSDGPLAAEAQFRIGENRVARRRPQRRRRRVREAADPLRARRVGAARPAAGRPRLREAQQPEKAERFFRELVDKHSASDEATTAKQHLRDRSSDR
jgi:hypothetical protein